MNELLYVCVFVFAFVCVCVDANNIVWFIYR